MQHEITKPIPLLDDRGNLTEPGWARRPLPVYDRSRVKGGPARRKEWDYYLVMGDGFALALTIADSSCLGVASISLLDFQEGGQVTRSPVPVSYTHLDVYKRQTLLLVGVVLERSTAQSRTLKGVHGGYQQTQQNRGRQEENK